MAIKSSTWLAWSPLLLLLAYMVAYIHIPKELNCQPMDIGSKEFMCGGEYAHSSVQLFANLVKCLYIALVLATGLAATRKKLSLIGLTGFGLSFAGLMWAVYFLWISRNDDSP